VVIYSSEITAKICREAVLKAAAKAKAEEEERSKGK